MAPPPPERALPIQKIGEYEITARLGVGGMGVVYEGRQPLIGKRVAVKVLLPSFSREKELVDRFIAEARAVNEIRHRGIVDIFGFGQLVDGSHYLVMEYLEGEPFDRMIKRRGAMPVGEVLLLAEEILDALDAAHAAGVIHRDIKPSNLFLVNQGRGRTYVKLLDFGIAKLGVGNSSDTPQTRASVILGTPDYISPEQARGSAISPRTDLYALGVVLFELLTGERPFQAENTLATMWMHVEDAPPRPSDIRPDLPPELDDLILWALEKDPANRPHSAEDMRAHVESIRVALKLANPLTTPSPVVGREPLPSAPPRRQTRTPLSVPLISKGRAPSPPNQETRLAPLPAFEDELPTRLQDPSPFLRVGDAPVPLPPSATLAEITSPGLESAEEEQTAADKAPERSNGGLIAIAIILLILVAVAGSLIMRSPTPPDPDASAAPPKPPAATVPIEAPVVIEPPVPVAEPQPTEPIPAAATASPTPPKKQPSSSGRVISAGQLAAQLAKLEATLAGQEKQTGEVDRIFRQFMAQAKQQVDGANTDAERRAASKFLDEIASQLGQSTKP